MKKKANIYLWVGLGVAVVLGIILYFAFVGLPKGVEKETEVPAGESEGGLSLSGCVLDKIGGTCLSTISNALQLGGKPSTPEFLSTILVENKPKCYGVTAVRLFSSLTKTGDVPSIDVTAITGTTNPTSTNFQTAINAQMTKVFTLSSTPNSQQVDVDTTGMTYNTPTTWTSFAMSITATYKGATGTTTTVTPTPQATLNVRLLPDSCDDGGTSVLWGACSPNKPKYCQAGVVGCEGGTGVAGSLINKCSTCGCPTGFTCVGESCVEDKCSDAGQTKVGLCVSPAPTENLQTNPNANKRFCSTKNQPLVEDCRGPDAIAGNGDDCGCAKDYYDSNPLSCGSAGICQYTPYSGNIVANLTG